MKRYRTNGTRYRHRWQYLVSNCDIIHFVCEQNRMIFNACEQIQNNKLNSLLKLGFLFKWNGQQKFSHSLSFLEQADKKSSGYLNEVDTFLSQIATDLFWAWKFIITR